MNVPIRLRLKLIYDALDLNALKFRAHLKLTPENLGFLVISLMLAATMPAALIYYG